MGLGKPSPNRGAVFLVDHYRYHLESTPTVTGLFLFRNDWGHTLPEDVRLALDAHRAYEQWDEPHELMRILVEQLYEDCYQNDYGAGMGTTLPDDVDYPVVVVDLGFKQVAFVQPTLASDAASWREHSSFQSYIKNTVADYPDAAAIAAGIVAAD